MKKKLISILLTVCMVLSLLPTAALAAGTATAVYVGGTDVSAGGYWQNDGSGGITADGATPNNYSVKFDRDTSTLTLNYANITTNRTWEGDSATSGTPNRSAAIHSTGALTVSLNGTNYLEGQTISGESAGMYIDTGLLTLRGNGSLHTSGKTFGICANDSITISSGVIDAVGANTGVHCSSNVFKIEGGTLTAAGSVHALNAGGSTLKSVYSTDTYASSTADGMTPVDGGFQNGTYYPYVRIGPTTFASQPTISPEGGSFPGDQTVTLTCTTPLANIYYTLDDSTPSASSTKYSGPFQLTPTATVKAIALKGGMTDSSVATATFFSNPVVDWDGEWGSLTGIGFNEGATNHLRVTMPTTTGYYTYGSKQDPFPLNQMAANQANLPLGGGYNWFVQKHAPDENGVEYTLTLCGAVWTTDFADGDALMSSVNLNLNLLDDNSITSTASGKSAVSTNSNIALYVSHNGNLTASAGAAAICALGGVTFDGTGTVTATGTGRAGIVSNGTIVINSGTVIGKSDTSALNYAPTLTNYPNHSLSVSTSADGSNPTTYDPDKIGTYKYFKVAPGMQHTITFDATGGAPVPVNATTTYTGNLLDLPADPTKAGHSFNGWFTAATGGTKITTNTVFTSNTTVYAQWISTPVPPPTPSTDGDYTPPKKPVIVDGKTQNIGTEKNSGGTTVITVDQPKLTEQIGKAKDGSSVVVPVSNNTTATVSLVVKNVEDMAKKSMTLSVKTGGITYDLPTASMDVAALAAAFPGQDTAKIPFEVTIKASDVKVEGATVVVKPVDFTVAAVSGGKSVSVDKFSVFVDRTFEITKAQSEKITTAVVVEHDGTLRHVPTYVFQKDGKYYAVVKSMTSSVYALIHNEVTFADAAGKWYEDMANEVGSRKIAVGTDKDTFHGDAQITRAEYAAMVVRALGLPQSKSDPFTDVAANAWYAGYVATASEYGIVKGIGNDRFDPEGLITRQQAMVMTHRAATVAGYTGGGTDTGTYTDRAEVGAWAADDVAFNLANGLIVGNDGKISPNATITRAQTATVLLRLLQKAELIDVRAKA